MNQKQIMKFLKLLKVPFFAAFVVLLLLNACKKETEDITPNWGYDYFPVELGQSRTYQVDSTIYDLFNESVYTRTHEVKEVIAKEDLDLEGRPRYTINRFIRTNSSTPWGSISPRVWYAVKTETSAERVEENLRFVKLSFPLSVNTTWQGNEHINGNDDQWSIYNDWLYEYAWIDSSYQLNNVNYPNTVRILQNDFCEVEDSTCQLQERIYGEEIYAEGIGLIYKDFQNLRLQASSLPSKNSNPWPDRANDGYRVTWKLIDVE